MQPHFVIIPAHAPTAIHLGSLAIKIGYADLRRRDRVRGRDVELKIELILQKLVHIPAWQYV